MNLNQILSKVKVLNERFSSWNYKIPKYPKDMVYDFYALTLIDLDNINRMELRPGVVESLEDLKIGFRNALESIVEYHYEHFLDFLPKVSMMEAYKHVDRIGRDRKECKESVIDWLQMVGADENYIKTLENTNILRTSVTNIFQEYIDERINRLSYISNKMLEDIIVLYEKYNWHNDFGGKEWANIVRGTLRFRKSKNSSLNKKIVMIDHIYDLQHNTGTVLNKCEEYAIGGSYEWVEYALDHKRDIIDSWELYDYISNQLKNPYAFYVYHTEGVALEDYLKDIENEIENRLEDIKERLKNNDLGYVVEVEKLDKSYKYSGIEFNYLVYCDNKNTEIYLDIKKQGESYEIYLYYDWFLDSYSSVDSVVDVLLNYMEVLNYEGFFEK